MSLREIIEALCDTPLLTRKDLARRYSVSLITIDEWNRHRLLPRPVYLKGVGRYGKTPRWRLSDIWSAEQQKPIKKKAK